MDSLRSNKAQLAPTHFDVVVIGADIQGISMANEAAERGLKTAIIDNRCKKAPKGRQHNCSGEAIELVSNLSFLEHLQLPEFLCAQNEMARLYQAAPYLVEPMTAFAVENPDYRSSTKLAFGAALHQRMTSKRFPTSIHEHADNSALAQSSFNANPVTLCKVNFQRASKQLLKRSAELGVHLFLAHDLVSAQREKLQWTLEVKPKQQSLITELTANALINCSGAESQDILEHTLRVNTRSKVEPLHEGMLLIQCKWHPNYATAIQTENDGWVYAFPFDENHMCLSALLVSHSESEEVKDETHLEGLKQSAVEDAIALWNSTFSEKNSQNSIVMESWAARAVVDDPSMPLNQRLRTIMLDLNHFDGHAPILNVLGYSPISFYKKSRQGLDILENYTGANAVENPKLFPSDHTIKPDQDTTSLEKELAEQFEFLPSHSIRRLVNAYGPDAINMLKNTQSIDDLGEHFGADLYEREVLFLLQKEYANCANDILWRHSYLGLHLNAQHVARLTQYVERFVHSNSFASSA